MLAPALLLLVAALASPPWPDVERDAEGRARDGQTLTIAPAPRRTIVALLPDRTTGRDWGLPHLARAVEDLRRIRPDAVFTIGDMVQGYTRRSATWDAEFAAYEAIVGALDMPVHPVAGNHDVVHGSRDPNDRTFEERYRARVGPLWYAAHLEHATILVLFTDDGPERIGEAQLAWLREALPAARARGEPILLLLHRPLWRSHPQRWQETVAPLLAEHPVDAVIAGHFHALHAERGRDGTPFHILGVAGGMIDQHPLAGHLHHLTLVEIDERDEVRVRHQPVGSTLPDDFVRAADRARAHRLANDAQILAFDGALPEPWPNGAEGQLALLVRNPVDRAVDVEISLVRAGEVVGIDGEAFVSTTLIDAFNPFVVDATTPFRLRDAPPIRIGPGESRRIALSFGIAATATPPPPPELRATLRFTDDRGRVVPVWRRLAPPIARRVRVGDGAADGPRYPLVPWVRSPYDTLESHPTLAGRIDENGALLLEVRIHDADRPDDRTPAQSTSERLDQPFHDALRIRLGDAPGATFHVEPFRGDRPPVLRVEGEALVPTDLLSVAVTTGVDGDPAACLVRLRVDPSLGPFEGMPLQVGFADNDATYHTQWRWLAPEGVPARLERGPRLGPAGGAGRSSAIGGGTRSLVSGSAVRADP